MRVAHHKVDLKTSLVVDGEALYARSKAGTKSLARP